MFQGTAVPLAEMTSKNTTNRETTAAHGQADLGAHWCRDSGMQAAERTVR